MKAVHLICRRNKDGKFKDLKLVNNDLGKLTYQSGYWAFNASHKLDELIGGWVYLHPASKRKASEFGGIVTAVTLVAKGRDDNKTKQDGYLLTIESHLEGRHQAWRGADHGMAWTGGLIEAQLAHEVASTSAETASNPK